MSEEAVEALAPVREALLRRARADADVLGRKAEQDARQTMAGAQREADAIRARARAQGEADTEGVREASRTRARRQARAIVLAAHNEVYEQLRRRARQSVTRLREDPVYPELRGALRSRARQVLGPDARLYEPPEGGVVGRSGGRDFACTLPDLAEQALATMPGLEGFGTT